MHQYQYQSPRAKIILLAIFLILVAIAPRPTFSASIDELRAKITENNEKIFELQKQIDEYSSLYNSTSKQAQTLKNALAALEANRNKLAAELKLTTTKITKTSLTLEEIGEDIATTEEKIDKSSKAVAQSIRIMDEAENNSVVEQFLGQKTISDAWDYVNGLRAVQAKISLALADLNDLKVSLASQKVSAEKERINLINLQKSLTGQKQVVEYNQQEKDKLLTQTKSDAAKYQEQLAEAVAQKALFEKELYEYESALNIAIDPSSIPGARSGVLSWPLKDIFVTQYFGYTAAAAKLYKTTGKHGGMDFRAAIGTPVYASLSGLVTDTVGTLKETKSGCQYGEFVLIKHANGLSTIYGHLSYVNVKPGDTVITGDLIGYSGKTGYSTGPHLHFGVYATQGVRIVDAKDLGSRVCSGIKTVAADPKAYLDPLGYLPKL